MEGVGVSDAKQVRMKEQTTNGEVGPKLVQRGTVTVKRDSTLCARLAAARQLDRASLNGDSVEQWPGRLRHNRAAAGKKMWRCQRDSTTARLDSTSKRCGWMCVTVCVCLQLYTTRRDWQQRLVTTRHDTPISCTSI